MSANDPVLIIHGTSPAGIKTLATSAYKSWLTPMSSASRFVGRTMPISALVGQPLRARLLLDQGQAKPFANVPGICSLGDKLCVEFLGERQHLFPDGVDEHHLREIDDEFQSDVTARDECTNLLSSLPGQSALESADQRTV